MPKSPTQIIEENISKVRKYVHIMERTPMLSDEELGELGWKIDKALNRIEKANKATMMVTLENLQKAEQLLKDHKVCGNWNGGESGHGCNKVFKTEEVIRTIQYGQTYYWCPACYERIKDD